MGLAFQIADDALDVESSRQNGKATAKTPRQEKPTFCIPAGLEGAKLTHEPLRGKQPDIWRHSGQAHLLEQAALFAVLDVIDQLIGAAPVTTRPPIDLAANAIARPHRAPERFAVISASSSFNSFP